MDRLRSVLQPIALCSVFIVFAEVSARVDDYVRWGAPFLDPYGLQSLRRVEEGFAVCKPGAKFEKWTLDSDGFRKIEKNASDDESELTIAVLGSSESFGLVESDGKEWPAQLQQSITLGTGCKVRVLNASCPGASIPNMINTLENRVLDNNPDVVVLYPTPQFYLDQQLPGTPIRGLSRGKFYQVRLARKIRSALKILLPDSLQTRIRKVGIERAIFQRSPDWLWDSVPEERKILLADDLDRLLRTVKRSDADIVLATHASRFGEVAGEVEDERLEYIWRRAYPRATLSSLVEIDGISNIKLRSASQTYGFFLADSSKHVGGDPSNFADFSHFTDLGAARMASIVSDTISEAIERTCK